MGVFRRLGDATRASSSDPRKRSSGRDDRPLSELSDRELEEELQRRRRERAMGRAHGGQRRGKPASPQEERLAQCYANLELSPGASLDEVRRSYRELMRKYHPDKYLGDPEKHRTAMQLARSLTEAYRRIVAHLGEK